MLAVFTDLDNCLLDHHSYDFSPALPALARLRSLNTTIVCTTSKTQAEVEFWHHKIGLHHPSIVENGGAVILENGQPVVLGQPRHLIGPALDDAAAESGASIRTFSQMPLAEIADRCNFSLDRARLAAARQYSEPFVLLNPESEPALAAALAARNLHLTRGGRFHHALAHTGKHAGAAWLIEAWRNAGVSPTTLGLGDAPNDEGFLALVDHPLRLLPGLTGPVHWNIAVLHTLDSLGL